MNKAKEIALYVLLIILIVLALKGIESFGRSLLENLSYFNVLPYE